jgi:hypothetical protein
MTTKSKNEEDDEDDEAKMKWLASYNKPRRKGQRRIRRKEHPTMSLVPQQQQRNCDNQTAKN